MQRITPGAEQLASAHAYIRRIACPNFVYRFRTSDFLAHRVRVCCRSSTESLQFHSRNKLSAQDDGCNATSVSDVRQWVRLEQDQIGLLPHFNGAFISKASDELSGIPS